MQPLSADERLATCYHEAGHAVAFALGGVSVERIAVAPLGATEWRVDSRVGRSCSDVWGLCVKAELVLPRSFLRWLMHEGALHADGRDYSPLLRTASGREMIAGFPDELQRSIRAQIVGLLAGPLAEGRWRSLADKPLNDIEQIDFAKAADLCALLPGADAYADALTTATLCLQERTVWQSIEVLATRLAEQGLLSAPFGDHLPVARLHWPPGPLR